MLDHLAASGLTAAEVAAAADVAPAPADPLQVGIQSLEQRVAALEAVVNQFAGGVPQVVDFEQKIAAVENVANEAASFIDGLKSFFGGKLNHL